MTRSGADKAKGGHDIDDKGRDERSDDGGPSGDVTREVQQEAACVRMRLGDVTRRDATRRDDVRRDVPEATRQRLARRDM